MFATKRTVKEIKAPLGNYLFLFNIFGNFLVTFFGTGVNPASAAAAAQATANSAGSAVDKLELAKKLASKITFTKTTNFDTKFATQQAAESILKGNLNIFFLEKCICNLFNCSYR